MSKTIKELTAENLKLKSDLGITLHERNYLRYLLIQHIDRAMALKNKLIEIGLKAW